MQREQLQLLVHSFVVDAFARTPRERAALGRGEVLHGMERERREVGHRANRRTLVRRAVGMGSIGNHDATVERLLQALCGMIQVALGFHSRENAVVIARNATEVDGDNSLRALGDCGLHGVVVHLVAAGSDIDHNGRCANVAYGAHRCSVGVRRHDDFVAFANAEQAQAHLERRSGGIQAARFIGAAKLGNLTLELFRFGAGGDPTRFQSLNNLVDFGLSNIGRRKLNTHGMQPFFGSHSSDGFTNSRALL